MSRFKEVMTARKNAKDAEKEVGTLGKAINERGQRTVKVPYFSDKKTGKMMIEKKDLSRKVPRLKTIFKSKRNRFVGKTGGKALLLAGAMYGGKTLIDDYERSNEKYAGYVSRVGDSASRLLKWTRRSNEVKSSSIKAGKQLKEELKRIKPDKNKLGHLNAKKVKEGITAKKKRNLEIAGILAGPATVVAGGVYLKKKYDESHPARMTNYYR